jgi:hypothetical protein
MYDLSELITHVAAKQPTYQVGWAKAKEMDLGSISDPVKVSVGYHSVDALGELGDGDTPDPYQSYSQDLVQFAVVQFTCTVTELPTVWRNIYSACATWTPIPSEADFSNFMHSGGGAMGIKDGRIWWLDKWRLSFPRVSTEWL